MPWSGKLVGGLVGGMLGGPVGAGLGATLGHVLADKDRPLEALGVEWRHHGFSPSGPGLWLNPVWLARGRRDREVSVRLDFGDAVRKAVVEPEVDLEECHVPRFFVPYARVGEATQAVVTLRSEGVATDRAAFDVELPSPVRRLGGSGPARVVMALVACARAEGRTLTRDDVRYVRESFTEGQELDDDGLLWLRTWVRELRDADPARLTPVKVARRLERHADAEARERMVRWLLRGPWAADEAPEVWLHTFAAALGVPDVDALRRDQDEGPDPWEVLGVPRDAPLDVVRAAYHTLVLRWHPDRAGPAEDAARRMAELSAAWRKIQGGGGSG